MATTVHVEGISTKTSEDEIKSFFSFCGKIQSISVSPTENETQSATVTFEKAAAAKTALLLDNTQLGPNSVHVSGAKSLDELAGDKATTADDAAKEHGLEQEDKPRGRIVAEYLAHGYTLSDQVINKALALDQQHGFSTKFTSYLKGIDQKTGATEKAQAADAKFGVMQKANTAWASLNSYYSKAADTPTGQKLRAFYEQGNKTVLDVHNEARHLADLKSGKQSGAAGASTEKGTEAGQPVEPISGTDKTHCNCGSESGKCPCAPGKCGCANCAKNDSDVSAPASTS
ncbi:RNA-binding protein Vip1 [Lophiotrema nucula]|uniref:RNA-binding protein Vip1 n=1 Tax=Lophiotrema nucula TaxID=690887 RepID=A0A6A5ZAS6_9PLEO|nr:RNA-binding protein Vip1 [Lophiotrema nucula]